MARFCFFSHVVLLCFSTLISTPDAKAVTATSPGQRFAGVFLLIDGGMYTFNYTSARDACLSLNVTIATRKQMGGAVQRGLETCKYGWIAEQIAVIPRIASNQNCGKGQIGVVPWNARADQLFAVFCFNASEETPNTTETSTQTTSSTPTLSSYLTTLTSTTRTKSPNTTVLKTPTKGPTTTSTTKGPTTSTQSPGDITSTSVFISRGKTTLSTMPPYVSTISSSASVKRPTTSSPTSPAQHDTVATADVATSVSVLTHTVSSGKASLDALPTSLIVIGVILLLLAAAGLVWYYKLNIFTFWTPGQDDTETEMWKQSNSEMDLENQHEDEVFDEVDRKCSSDFTLCVNPNLQMKSSE